MNIRPSILPGCCMVFLQRQVVFIVLFWLLLPPGIPKAGSIRAQNAPNPYRLSWKLDAPLSIGSASGIGGAMWIKKHKKIFTPEDIERLNTQSVWRIDRFATQNWHVPAQKTSDVFMYGSMALPLLLFANAEMRQHAPKLALIGLETYMLNAALTSLTKELVQRKRPYLYNPDAPMHLKRKPDATSSFFSGHTSASAAATFLAAKMYADYHPNSRFKPYIWIGAAILPAVTGYLRVRGGKHYLTDVIVGYAVGAATGILVPHLHKQKQ
ncbi:MAG TPA: phosphatase PAP2 family protein [Chitinophagales bacterium]|nr:phosphatase PAP2 family protein [Chitinophagales bacterium]